MLRRSFGDSYAITIFALGANAETTRNWSARSLLSRPRADEDSGRLGSDDQSPGAHGGGHRRRNRTARTAGDPASRPSGSAHRGGRDSAAALVKAVALRPKWAGALRQLPYLQQRQENLRPF